MSDDIKYSTRVKVIQTILTRLQTCDDVEDAIQMYEEATQHIQACAAKIRQAEGKFTELTNSGDIITESS